jgi:septum site-determining protein MinC
MPANSSTAGAQRPAAIDVRFGQIGLIQLQLRTLEPACILEDLRERIAAAPRFFERMAVGLDITALPQAPETRDLRPVLDAVRHAGLTSIGLITGQHAVEGLAGELHLPVLGNLQSRPLPASATGPQAAAPTDRPAAAKEAPAKEMPLFHERPVRSGQRLYARNRDLVILANVGSGAEVIADGCVHIHGSLRGRALAGARGERGARVICHDFHAELISVAGVYRVFESLPPELAGRPVQAWLSQDDLRLSRIGMPAS